MAWQRAFVGLLFFGLQAVVFSEYGISRSAEMRCALLGRSLVASYACAESHIQDERGSSLQNFLGVETAVHPTVLWGI